MLRFINTPDTEEKTNSKLTVMYSTYLEYHPARNYLLLTRAFFSSSVLCVAVENITTTVQLSVESPCLQPRSPRLWNKPTAR